MGWVGMVGNATLDTSAFIQLSAVHWSCDLNQSISIKGTSVLQRVKPCKAPVGGHLLSSARHMIHSIKDMVESTRTGR